MKMSISSIIVTNRLRPLDHNKITELSESIKVSGLLNPITVTNKNFLVAGNHRLEACKKLGHKEIEVNVIEAEGLMLELAEIDENLIRNELHYIDRCNHLARKKEIYEELYPETKKGAVNQYTKEVLNDLNAVSKSFIKDSAEKMNVAERTIGIEIQIAKNVLPETQQILKEKNIPKKDALNIARMKPNEQKKVTEILKQQDMPNLPKALQTMYEYKAPKRISTAEVMRVNAEIRKPSEEGNLKNTETMKPTTPIIQELLDVLNSFHVNINKFTYLKALKSLESKKEVFELLNKASENIKKIKKLMEE